MGRASGTVTELPTNRNFTKTDIGPDIPELPGEVRRDLSTDQLYGYNMVMAIRSGVLPDRFASLGARSCEP